MQKVWKFQCYTLNRNSFTNNSKESSIHHKNLKAILYLHKSPWEYIYEQV